MAQEEEVRVGFGKYVLLVITGILLVAVGKIVSSAIVYVSPWDPLYKNLTFASHIARYIGVTFLSLPLIVGGILRDDIKAPVRVAMVVMGCILLAWLFY